MTDRYGDNNSGTLAFDPNSQGQDQGPTQGQGQGKYNVDPANRGNLDSDIYSESRDPTQQQGQRPEQYNPTTRAGGDQYQATNQAADPNFDRNDPARDRFDDRTRFSGPGGGQDYSQPDQQGQRRQGGQIAGENVPYGAGSREPRHGGHRDQLAGFPQERVDAGNYATSTGIGPGSRPNDQEIYGDDRVGGKPPMTERVIGTAEKIVGKATGNARMYEHGQQHKSQGY